jgi:S-DNA-T family DNA segregation ATPase FtsK/SpoIIIE
MSQANGSAKASAKRKSTRVREAEGPQGEPLIPVVNPSQPAPRKKNAVEKPAVPPTSPEEEKGDLVTELWLRFGKYGWDLLGVSLIAFALLTLVGILNRELLVGLSNGVLLSLWVNNVTLAMGWGWPLLVIVIALLGLMCLRNQGQAPKIHLGRVLALEGVAFAFLTFLTIWNGWSLERVLAGKDGGWIGWGLARILGQFLPDPWGAILLIALMILLTAYGTGAITWSLRRLEGWLNAVNPAGAAEVNAGTRDQAVSAAASPEAVEQEDEENGADVLPELPARRDPNLPPLTLLLDEKAVVQDDKTAQETARRIVQTLAEFGIPATVKGYLPGPTVTQFAVEPGFVEKTGPEGELIQQKVRVSQISALARDLALALSAERLRIEAPVPGRSYVGIEVPNQENAIVRLRPLVESEDFLKLSSPLAIALGKDVAGQPLVADLARMPHLLIAGTTGSGKSVCIAAIVTCLATNNRPEDLRMVLLDPKMVELVRFNGLPHMFGRVETELDRMLGVLRWALMEMDHRYRLLEDARARDIQGYNRKMEKRGQPKLPRIVVIIDELADLMMTAPDQTEHSLIRLAQMARATGIHLVVATQRPSTDVVTGLIKANFPARLAFTVASSIDSRVILDGSGAETLLGKGDMLFLNPEAGVPLRAQGVLIADEEIEAVIRFWKQKLAADPNAAPPEAAPWEGLIENAESEDGDALVEQAIKIVRATQRASTSLIQRRLRIGYPRAARLMDELAELGVVGPSMGGGREREVLLPPEESVSADDDPEEEERGFHLDSDHAAVKGDDDQ